MRKAIDAVAHHESHGAGVVIGPDRLSAEFTLGLIETRGDFVERLIPGNPRELARTLWSGAPQRMEQPVGVMNALGVTRDLRADDARRIGLQLGAADPADRAAVDHLDVERAGRRTIVRTGGVADIDLGMLVHAFLGNIKRHGRREGLFGGAPAKTAVSHASGAQIGAAIGVDRLPVDVARAGPAQKTHGCGDVFRQTPIAGDGLMGQMMGRLRLVLGPWRADQRREPRSSR